MELKQEIFRVSKTVCRGTAQTIAMGDIIVPDTKSDILKIIQVDADAHITDKSIRDEKLILAGKTDLKILYIPDSETDKISSINTSFDFLQEISCPGADEDMFIIALANVSRADFSVINSRKLHVKTTIALDYEITDASDVGIAAEVIDDCGAEVKRENIGIQNIADICSHTFILRENLELPQGQPPVRELLKTDVQITDTEYKAVTGKIVLKGTALICLLYTTGEGNIEHAEMELPFTEIVDSEGVGDNSECEVEYAITCVDCSVSEDSDGEARIIGTEIEAQVQIKAMENNVIDMITDCYVPCHHTELIKETIEMEEIIAKPSAQNTLKEIVEVPSGIPSVRSVYNVVMKPYLTKTEPEDGKLLCEGKIEAYVLYLSDSSDNPVYSVRKEIPFGYVLNYDDMSDGLTAHMKAEIKHSGYNMNSAGEVELRCILSLSAHIIRKRKEEIITGAEVTEIDDDEERGIVIYFVQKGDELWDISKRYAVPIENVIQYNDIKEGEHLRVGERVFIPV